jgi:hypothetical protein
MNAVATKPEVGDYDLRGTNIETLLVKAITPDIIDAARFVREGYRGDLPYQNGFPNWAIYRTAAARDTHMALNLRAWCEAFGMAYVATCGARKGGDALGVCAGRDAYLMLTERKWGAPADELAPLLGITPKTYREHRKALAARLTAALGEYFVRMEIAMRQVALLNAKQESPRPSGALLDGRGFGHEVVTYGDGNYRAMPRGSGC